MRPRVAVAILAVRNAVLLEESLASIRRHADGEPPHQVVIVLNGATDEVRECVRVHARDAVVVDSPVNLGTGGGFNRAFAATDAPFMVIAHDDSEVTERWLSPLVERMDADPSLGAVGGCITGFDGRVEWMGGVVFRDGSTRPEWVGEEPPRALVEEPRDVAYHGGLGLLIRRDAWEAVGGFDDISFYPAYYPDADFCFRLRAAGWAVSYEPGSVLRHHWGRSTTPPFRRFIAARNRDVFARHHAAQLAAHAEPAHDDASVVDAEVQRAARVGRPATPPRRADADALSTLRERLQRTPLEYARLECDIWRAFAAHQTELLDDAARAAAVATASRQAWQHTARAVGDDRDSWRGRAADLAAAHAAAVTRLANTGEALERTTATLTGMAGSRWWRLAERLRQLRR